MCSSDLAGLLARACLTGRTAVATGLGISPTEDAGEGVTVARGRLSTRARARAGCSRSRSLPPLQADRACGSFRRSPRVTRTDGVARRRVPQVPFFPAPGFSALAPPAHARLGALIAGKRKNCAARFSSRPEMPAIEGAFATPGQAAAYIGRVGLDAGWNPACPLCAPGGLQIFLLLGAGRRGAQHCLQNTKRDGRRPGGPGLERAGEGKRSASRRDPRTGRGGGHAAPPPADGDSDRPLPGFRGVRVGEAAHPGPSQIGRAHV